MYTKKFTKEVIINTANKLNIPEEEVYIIYVSLEKAINKLMKDPFVRCIKIPIIGSFVIRSYKIKTLYKRQTNKLNILKSKLDGLLKFDFNFYSNLKFHIDRIEKFDKLKKNNK